MGRTFLKILVISSYREAHSARPEAETIIGLKDLGHEITVMTYLDAEYCGRFREKGIKVIGGHPDRRYDATAVKAIKNELASGDYDILLLYNHRAIINGVRAARNAPVKVVIYRSAIHIEWWNPLAYFKYLSPRIDKVICNSIEIRDEFRNVPLYDKNKAVTIYKGHDPSWYDVNEIYNLHDRLSIPDDHTIFITVGNDRRIKGTSVILDAIQALPPDVKASFIFIGRGLDEEHYGASVSKTWKSRVKLLGFQADAMSYMAGSDVFIQASTAGESLTKALIQAMCLRKMPIISDIQGNAPLVEDGKNGLKFKAGASTDLCQKIKYTLDNPEIIKSMGEKSRTNIDEHFHVNNSIEEYDRLLRMMVKN